MSPPRLTHPRSLPPKSKTGSPRPPSRRRLVANSTASRRARPLLWPPRRIPDIPNMQNIQLTNNDKCLKSFGHTSGLDETTGQNSAAISNVFAFRVCSVLSKIGGSSKTNKYYQLLTKRILFKKGCRLSFDALGVSATGYTDLCQACLKPMKHNVSFLKRLIFDILLHRVY